MTLGSVGDLRNEQPFSIAFWLKYGGGKQPMPIFEKIDSPQTRRGWEIWLDEPVLVGIQKRAAHLSIRLSSQWPSSALELRTRERFTQGEWNHLAVISDGTGKASGLTIYVNGIRTETDILHDQLSGPTANTADLRSASKSPLPRRSPVVSTTCDSMLGAFRLPKSGAPQSNIRLKRYFRA